MINPAKSSEASPTSPLVSDERAANDNSRAVEILHSSLRSRHADILTSVQSLFYIIIVAVFIITFTVQPFRIPSESMEPTLLVGDFLLVNKQGLGLDEADGIFPTMTIRRGEIIVFHYPVDPALHLIKRVVGMPGDHLKLHNGHVYINGHVLTEPYAVYRASSPDSFRDNFPHLQSADPDIDSRWWIKMHSLIDHGELIIPSDNYFVLGDDSEDSRYWGFVPRLSIVGKPFLIYFSLQHRDDDLGMTAAFAASEAFPRVHPSWIEALVDFARWDRTLRIVH
jgi:signal peptidase I